jgi:hypothetical protein
MQLGCYESQLLQVKPLPSCVHGLSGRNLTNLIVENSSDSGSPFFWLALASTAVQMFLEQLLRDRSRPSIR